MGRFERRVLDVWLGTDVTDIARFELVAFRLDIRVRRRGSAAWHGS